MTSRTTKAARPHRPANSSLVAAATSDREATVVSDAPIAVNPSGSCEPQAAAVATSCSGRLRSRAVRNRKRPSAEPLAAFRATGDTPWKKAERNEVKAVQLVGELGLLSVRQIADWVFKDLCSPSTRLRQAQALTLRLCPAARAHSTSARLATAGNRPVLRAFGRKKVGNQHYYYLNTRGLRLFLERYNMALPDAAKSLTTVVDMAQRELVFEHLLTLHRADPRLTFRGRAAMQSDVLALEDAEPLARALLLCLSNLWCCRRKGGRLTYTYVADRAGSSNGVKLALYRELAKAASAQLGKDIRVDIIGRRLPDESALPLTDTRLARKVIASSRKELFWSTDRKRYEVQKLVAFFSSLKPFAEQPRKLMEALGA